MAPHPVVTPVITRKKLIEVALPLEAINIASAREKSIRHGHPSTLHLWWARRPLAAARAVLFSQLVDDPGSHPDLFSTPKAQEKERQRLFRIIEDLVLWENTTNEEVLDRARAEIWQSWRSTCADNTGHPRAAELFDRHKLPAFHDPFAGGGAIPLEAQRLGLESYASDLNPVAVLINKAMIEIPPKFAGREPVNPAWRNRASEQKGIHPWKGAQGLADDVRYYGQWMRDRAQERIGHLYPDAEVTEEMARERPDLQPYVGRKLKVIAWLWARTVKSPNPAFANVDVPLASTFMLSTKSGKEAYVEPVIENGGYRFTVKIGKPENPVGAKNGTKLSRGANFRCVMSEAPIASEHIYFEANAGKMGAKLMAVVAEGERGRVYLAPTGLMEEAAGQANPTWKPELAMPNNPRWFSPPLYGLKTFGDLFTPRQLVALTTFSDLVSEAREQVKHDALSAGLPDDSKPLDDGGTGANAYADAVAVYLAFATDRLAMTGNSLVRWNSVGEKAQHCFGRQALPMLWDYAEPNCLADATGSISAAVFYSSDPLNYMSAASQGQVMWQDAMSQKMSTDRVVSTDPPYYDNVGYADLADFFYIWLRCGLKNIFPKIFAGLQVPKDEELVATPYRHGNKTKAETFFLTGMTRAMKQLARDCHPAFPTTIYYAFKQAGGDDTALNGWETFLEAVLRAGFALTGTWPVRTEMKTRQVAMETNALASSIVLVCRARAADAPTATRRELVNALKAELPTAVAHLQRGNIAPVDLAQAAIGPGMAIYTKYAQVLDAEGKPLSVRQALALINEILDEVLAEQEGDFDPETRWAVVWFDDVGFSEGEYGRAETLSKAKNSTLGNMSSIVTSRAGKVRLLKPEELREDWDPSLAAHFTVWEMVHQLVQALDIGAEPAAAALVAQIGSHAEVARELAYRLFTIAERKKRASEALAYNSLVQSWPEILRLAREQPAAAQSGLFEETV